MKLVWYVCTALDRGYHCAKFQRSPSSTKRLIKEVFLLWQKMHQLSLIIMYTCIIILTKITCVVMSIVCNNHRWLEVN